MTTPESAQHVTTLYGIFHTCLPLQLQVESEGGAIHVETEWAAGSGNSVVILGARFTNNTSGGTGGAVVVNGQNLQLQDSLFERNTVSKSAACMHLYMNST